MLFFAMLCLVTKLLSPVLAVSPTTSAFPRTNQKLYNHMHRLGQPRSLHTPPQPESINCAADN